MKLFIIVSTVFYSASFVVILWNILKNRIEKDKELVELISLILMLILSVWGLNIL